MHKAIFVIFTRVVFIVMQRHSGKKHNLGPIHCYIILVHNLNFTNKNHSWYLAAQQL